MTRRTYFGLIFGALAVGTVFWNVQVRIDEAAVERDELALRGCLHKARIDDRSWSANRMIDCAKSLPNGFGIAGRDPIVIAGPYHGIFPPMVGGRMDFTADRKGDRFFKYQIEWRGKPHGYTVE